MDNSDSAGKEGRPRVDHPTRIPDVFPYGYNRIRFRRSNSASAGVGWEWRVFNPPSENASLVYSEGPSHLYNLPAALVGGVGNYDQNVNPSGGMNEEVDSHGKFKTEEVPHDNREKYKTQLCYHWERHGYCLYGDHCVFAHGEQELRPVTRHARYKTKLCYNVLASGSCRFGHQCHFRHALSDNI